MENLMKAVEKNRQLILDAEHYLWQNPETGFKEVKSSRYLEEQFQKLGYEVEKAEGITGFCVVVDTGREGPELLILGEMDSVICASHPAADPETGAVHACGHHAQCAALLGIAAALKEPGALDGLSGKIRLCAVPAEELLEVEFRAQLKEEGKIRYMGGKSEFLARGYFDNVDLAFMVHAYPVNRINRGMIGCIVKKIIYKGVSAHAGGRPWMGKNALYAANCGLNAINAIRETFREPNMIRVHPIITSGGAMVNAIPERVTLESYVRGKTFEAIRDANRKVDRALIGAALSLDTNIEIQDIPGYTPLVHDTGLMKLAEEAFYQVCPGEPLEVSEVVSAGCSDMGDLSAIMPVVHPYIGGATGNPHGNDFIIADPEMACVNSAKWQLTMASLLLRDGGQRAKKIVSEFQPRFASKEAFLTYLDSLQTKGDRIFSQPDGTAVVKL